MGPARGRQEGELGGELEQPGPAIRALETAGGRGGEVGAFGGDFLWGELAVEQGGDGGGGRHGGEAAEQAGEQPVAVHAGVPVEAAVEHRMQLGRGARVGGAGEGVVGLVGVFALDMAECDLRELGGDGFGQGVHGPVQCSLTAGPGRWARAPIAVRQSTRGPPCRAAWCIL